MPEPFKFNIQCRPPTREYREGWDRIFGPRSSDAEHLNDTQEAEVAKSSEDTISTQD
jgi:hypothetical protein